MYIYMINTAYIYTAEMTKVPTSKLKTEYRGIKMKNNGVNVH